MHVLFWVVLGSALLLGTFGIGVCLTLILSAIIFCAGWVVAMRWCSLEESEEMWLNIHRAHLPIPRDQHDKVVSCIKLSSSTERQDRRVSGSSLIDEQLQGVVTLVVRDFVLSWYSNLSNHQAFISQLHRTIQQSMVVLANRCKSMDWVSYLTTRLVDDIAGHLRLFREARSAGRGKVATGEELIDQFFEKEAEKERDICRDEVCLKPEAEMDYLSDLAEIILYYILPAEDFSNAPLLSAAVELLVSSVVLPLVSRISDPDYINTLIIWGCTDIPITSELFVSVIKSTSNLDELEAVRSLIVKEMTNLRSRDSGGREEGNEVKQQLGSLEFIKRVIDNRINRIDKGSETDSMGLPVNLDYQQVARGKLFQLPLEAILKNSLTLDHFLRYMASVNAQHYITLYHNIECWRTTVSERLCALELERLQHLEEAGVQGGNNSMPDLCHDHFSAHDLSSHKEEAEMIYEQYLSEKASPRVIMDDSKVKRLILRIRSEKVAENWFDEVQTALFTTLQEADLFLPAFRRSTWYIQLLAELDLLKDVTRSDEEDSHSLDDVSFSSLEQEALVDVALDYNDVAASSGCLLPFDLISLKQGEEGEAPSQPQTTGGLSADSLSVTSSHSAHSSDNYLKSVSRGSSRAQSPQPGSSSLHPSPCHTRSPSLSSKSYTLTAKIIDTEIVRDGNKSHAIYIVSVMRRDASGQEELWHVFRRYSEFYDFHLSITSKFQDLSSVSFPSKRMLNNLAAWFLEKRKTELNDWLQTILVPAKLQSHPGLQEAIQRFLDQTSYLAKEQNLAKKVEENFVAPIRLGVSSMSKAVRSMPDTVLNTVDGVVDGIYRKFVKPTNPRFPAATDYPHRGSFDLEGDENIPLRILLLLMDEVFDLRSKDQWFRRRIMLFLRQILKAMFGDIVNRRIVDYVAFITSPEQVADYIKTFKESLWPNGVLMTPPPERDDSVKMRTRVAARTSMLASISDELKAILGSQTTARGVLGVYETVQWTALNKRLVYVLLEGIIESLLANQRQIPPLIRSLHTGSARIAARNAPHSRRGRTDR